MLRRLAVTAVASLAALSAAAPAATAVAPVPPLLLPLPLFLQDGQDGHEGQDGPGAQDGLQDPWARGAEAPAMRMTVTVSDSGDPAADGTFELLCGPAGGTHARAQAACDRLAEAEAAGENPFLPTPENGMCTQIYGGPATARIVGTWQGQNFSAYLNRVNGCEVSRWNNLIPVLPAL
ncbi:subtilase-type protease inhibitor [Streptomyces sp. NBC_00234]|uniref:SSI family serine proteinase inhibitor n=1 Tax=Streptomyces sp. NBC_00234 TaxID=2903638 RepID=UPI002E2DF2B8|nr:SSI family serine proteinase inhibitor [Streptomyces sp. NBC_00234]